MRVGRRGLRAKVGTHRSAQRDQNWVCGIVRQVSRTGTLAYK